MKIQTKTIQFKTELITLKIKAYPIDISKFKEDYEVIDPECNWELELLLIPENNNFLTLSYCISPSTLAHMINDAAQQVTAYFETTYQGTCICSFAFEYYPFDVWYLDNLRTSLGFYLWRELDDKFFTIR